MAAAKQATGRPRATLALVKVLQVAITMSRDLGAETYDLALDDELATITVAAAPLQPHQRSEFLRDVSAELARYPEIGAGIIHRVVRELQREHLNSSRLHPRGVSKFGT